MLFQTEIKLSKSEKSLIKSLIFYYENDAKEILEKNCVSLEKYNISYNIRYSF